MLHAMDAGDGLFSAVSCDGFRSFSQPLRLSNKDHYENGIRHSAGICNMYYNKFHHVWLTFAHCGQFENEYRPICVGGIAVGHLGTALFDVKKNDIKGDFHEVPFPMSFITVGSVCTPIEFDNGDMLLALHYTTPDKPYCSVITVRYALDKDRLRIVKIGTPIDGKAFYDPNTAAKRGLCEPSVTYRNGKYYAALRNDEAGYYAESDDGYTFSAPKLFVWDDGTPIGNYNTMQKWVRFDETLYLVYTRRDRLNGHVFRHRAPLYITRFDEARGCLIRNEEQILVPELGARLGNFYVTELSGQESVITTAEWMQPAGCEKYGSDNSIWLVRVQNDTVGSGNPT